MMTRLAIITCILLMAFSATMAAASPFDYDFRDAPGTPPYATPPEPEPGSSPDDLWWHPEIATWSSDPPEQRNALIDFATSPFSSWPAINPGTDIIPGWFPHNVGDPGFDIWDLQDPTNYHMQGTDDDQLFETDWFAIYDPSNVVQWYTSDSIVWGTNRQGILYADAGLATNPITVDFFWHIDNWPGGSEKHFYDEIYYVTFGETTGMMTELLLPDGSAVDLSPRDPQTGDPIVISGTGYEAGIVHEYNRILNDAGGQTPWVNINSFATLRPNPEFEILHISITLLPGVDPQNRDRGRFSLDSIHVATECNTNDIPEPGTMALFGLGAVGLIFWRRRRSG